MNKLNYNSLKQFDLTFPGHWIKAEDRDQAFQTQHTLGLIQGLFIEAVASYALFKPITAENVRDYMARFERGDETPYERCLNGLYAKAFVFALDGIEKLLNRLVVICNPPKEIEQLYEEYKKLFGHLKHIRDSAMPIPLIPDARSDLFRTVVPIEGGQLFRFIPATLSERSDAGV